MTTVSEMPRPTFWQAVRRNSGLADDSNWRRFVVRWSLVSLLLIGVAAYNSYGFFKFDEHYQVVEFVGYKLGKTPENQLAWEYRAQIRPWLQPAMYYAAAKAMIGLGVENPFTLATGFRAISGLFGWLAITSLMLSANVLFGPGRRRRLAVMLLALMWLIPYLAVRTSAESLSGDFLTLGVAVLLLGSTAEESNGGESTDSRNTAASRRRLSPAAALIAGICFGLSFEFRFQIAFAILGVMGWMTYFSADHIRARIGKLALLCGGGLAALAIGTLVDRWGYGQWTCVPWHLFHVDVVQGRPSLDGIQPLWWYFVEMVANPMAPIALLWTLAMVATWIRYPRHIVTWATLPFFIGHSLVPHKELRYLFPLAMLGTLFFVIALVPSSDARPRPAWLSALWRRRRSGWAKALMAINCLGLAYACFVAHEPSLNFQRYLYNHYPNGCTMYVLGEKTRSPLENVGATMYFYRPPNFTVKRLRDDDELATILRHDGGGCLVVRDRLANWAPPADASGASRLIYHTYPTWVENFDYFNWLQNSKRFNLYAVNPLPAPADPAATALQEHPNTNPKR
jgi:phosphatidylinositol glycan class B